jgi:hypothetical protein
MLRRFRHTGRSKVVFGLLAVTSIIIVPRMYL